MNKTLFEIIDDSVFGTYTNIGYLDGSGNTLEITRSIIKKKSGYLIKSKVKNISTLSINIYSFLVADILIPSELKVRKVLENSWLQSGTSYYKDINRHTKRNLFFLKLNQNPLSFDKKYGYLDRSVISEWYSVLIAETNNFIFGAVTIEDQFSQVYAKREKLGTRVRLTSQFDGLEVLPGQTVSSETFFVEMGEEGKIKNNFAKLIAEEYKIFKVKDPINAICMSYYWNANYINEKIINQELDVIESMGDKLNLDYIQLDAGYSKYFGDWLNYRDNFPNGLKPIVDRIKRMNFKAGIWMAPVLVNAGSRIHADHKSWLLHAVNKRHLKGLFVSPFDSYINSINSDILDITNDEAREYIKESLKKLLDMGFDLFKIDFVYPLCFAKHFSKPITRAQAVRKLMRLVRSVLGDSKILSGMVPLSPVVGLVDYVRTGNDSLFPKLPPFIKKIVNNLMLKTNTQVTIERSFLDGVVWRSDPDIAVFKDQSGIDKKIREEHIHMVLSNKMNKWVGERLFTMSPKEIQYVKSFFAK